MKPRASAEKYNSKCRVFRLLCSSGRFGGLVASESWLPRGLKPWGDISSMFLNKTLKCPETSLIQNLQPGSSYLLSESCGKDSVVLPGSLHSITRLLTLIAQGMQMEEGGCSGPCRWPGIQELLNENDLYSI